MDVFGTVTAALGLLSSVKSIIGLIRQITSKTRMDEVARDVKPMLARAEHILDELTAHSGIDQGPELQGLVEDIKYEINKIQEVLAKLGASHKGSSRVLKRAHLVVGGFEKDLKSHAEKLDKLNQYLREAMEASKARHAELLYKLEKVHEHLRIVTTTPSDKRLQGTLEWIWTHPVFKSWVVMPQMQDSRSTTNGNVNTQENVLMIHGVMGCGKSVLAEYVANELGKKHQTLSFSFSSDRRDQRDIKTLLRALLWQILEILPEKRQLHHIPGLLDKAMPINELEFLMGKVCELAAEVQSGLYVVIDGIDESEDDWNLPLQGPLDSIETLLKSNSQIRLLLIGRQSSLQGAFRRWPLRIELTSDLIRNDIHRLISSELARCPEIKEEKIRHEIQDTLELKSANMYLWIKYLFDDLRHTRSEHEIREALNRRPDDLDRHYSRMLSNIMTQFRGESARKRSRDLLTLIVGAARPLTMTELRHAHAYALPLTPLASSYQANFVSREAVIEVCGGFISVEQDVVQLVHTSMREFFLRAPHLWARQDEHDIEFFRLELQDCHRALGLSCLAYMQHIEWQGEGNSDMMRSFIKDNEFLDYASNYFFSHLMGSNLSLQNASDLIFELVNSGKVGAWMNMMSYKETEGSGQVSTPIQFWDDACHFLGAWGSLDASLKSALKSIRNIEPASSMTLNASVQDQSSEWRSEAILDHVIDYIDDNESGDNIGLDLSHRDKREGKKDHSPAFKTHRLTRHARDNLSLMIRNLPMGDSMMKLRTLPIGDPTDAVMAPLVRSIQGMSFFALMNIGLYTYKVLNRRYHAFEMFQAAFQKVQREAGIRAAWARLWLGHTSSPWYAEDTEAHYREAMKILDASPMNPLQEHMWCVAAQNLIRILFGNAKKSDAMDLAAKFNQMVVGQGAGNASDLASRIGFLGNRCYRTIKKTPLFKRKKIGIVLEVAEIYEDENLSESLDELLRPFVDGTMSTNGINHRSFSRILALWLEAMVELKATDDAIHIIMHAKKGVSKMFRNAIWFQLAKLAYNDGGFELASDRLSKVKMGEWLRECSHDDAVATIDCLLGTWARTPDADPATLQTVLAQDHYQAIDRLPVILDLLLSHGLFSTSEKFIQGIMSKSSPDEQSNHAETLNLYEALAFSARIQSGQKAATSSYETYKQCLDFAKEKLPDVDATRIRFGMGLACMRASRPGEAAAIFRQLVNGYIRASYVYRDFFLALASQQDGHNAESHRLFHKIVSTLGITEPNDDEKDVEEQTSQMSDDNNNKIDEGRLQASVADADEDEMSQASSHGSSDTSRPRDGSVAELSLASSVQLDEEEEVLLVTAYMCLAEVSTTDGSPGYYRGRALEVLETRFAQALDPTSCPRTQTVSRWTLRWAHTCKEFLRGRIDGEEGGDEHPIMFPFDVWWLADIGKDYFGYHSCSI